MRKIDTFDGARQNYLKFTLREPVDFAIVSVASVITMDHGVCTDARIALGAVAPEPIRAKKTEEVMKGRPIDQNVAEEAAEQAVASAKPLSMNGYKVEITKALVKKGHIEYDGGVKNIKENFCRNHPSFLSCCLLMNINTQQ